MKSKILGAQTVIRFWCLSNYWNYYFARVWMPTSYTVQAKVYSGLLWCRERISSPPTPTPSTAEFSCIQHHVKNEKWAFQQPVP